MIMHTESSVPGSQSRMIFLFSLIVLFLSCLSLQIGIPVFFICRSFFQIHFMQDRDPLQRKIDRAVRSSSLAELFSGDQIVRYIEDRTAAALKEQYGEMLPAYLFQHIIVPEIYDLLTEVPASEKKAEGVVKGFSSHSGHYYKMGDAFTAGHLGEAPCPPDIPSGEFAAMRDTGDVVAAFFGHDHKNDFVGTYEGIDLVNTAGTGFYIYGEREYHGARLVILHENTPAEYDTEMLYYKDLVSEPLPGGLTSIHGKYVENIVIAPVAGLLVLIGAGVYAGVRLSRRRKRGQKQ